MRRTVLLAAALSGHVHSFCAQAEDAESELSGDSPAIVAPAAQATQLPPIVVNASVPSDLSRAPGAAERLDDDDLTLLRPVTLHDAMGLIAGVRHIDDDAAGRRSGIGIRGAPVRRSRKTLLLEDGVPINASAYLDPSAHYTPPTERLQAIDVLKGAGHVLHGPLNNHGIVNLVNRRPATQPETVVEAGIGSLDTVRRHLRHSRSDGQSGLLLSYTGLDAAGIFDVEDVSFDDLFAAIEWRVDGRHHFDFTATYFRERSHYDESNLTPVEFMAAPRRKRDRFGQEYNSIALDYQKYVLAHAFDPAPHLTVTTRLFATDVDRPRFTVDPDEVEADELPDIVFIDPARAFVPGVSGVMIGRDRHYRTYGADLRFQFRAAAASGPVHEWQWGLRVERHFLDDRESFGDIGEVLSVRNRGRYAGANELERARFDRYQASAAAAFVQDTLHIGRLSVTPGLRVERYQQTKIVVLEGDALIGDREADAHTLALPSLSLLYGLEDLQIFANVARGYTPAFARTAEAFPLKPETGINSQIGLRVAASPQWIVSGAVFYNRIHDTVIQEPFTIDDRNLVVNAEDSVAYGLDLGIRASQLLEGNRPSLFAEIAYSLVRSVFTAGALDGKRVPEVPLHAGSLTVGLTHPVGWDVSATASHFGSFFTDLANTRGRVLADEDGVPIAPGDPLEIREPAVLGEVAGHTLYSARASYRVHRTTVLWLQGRNLSDKLYVTDHVNGMRPGVRRSLVAGVTLTF